MLHRLERPPAQRRTIGFLPRINRRTSVETCTLFAGLLGSLRFLRPDGRWPTQAAIANATIVSPLSWEGSLSWRLSRIRKRVKQPIPDGVTQIRRVLQTQVDPVIVAKGRSLRRPPVGSGSSRSARMGFQSASAVKGGGKTYHWGDA